MKKIFSFVILCLFASITPVFSQGILDIFKGDDAKEVVKDVLENVAGDHIKFSIVGDWNYEGATVDLGSDNQIANIGSKVLGSTLDKKINDQLAKLGIRPGEMSIDFSKDSTFVIDVEKRKIKGSYSYDANTKKLRLVLANTVPVTVDVQVLATNIQFLFQADALLSFAKKIGSSVQIDAVQTISKLLNNYDNLSIGLKFSAADGRDLGNILQ